MEVKKMQGKGFESLFVGQGKNKGKAVIDNMRFPSAFSGSSTKSFTPENVRGLLYGDVRRPVRSMPQRTFLRKNKRNDYTMFSDSDGDGVVNGLDCFPFDWSRHGSDPTGMSESELREKARLDKQMQKIFERDQKEKEKAMPKVHEPKPMPEVKEVPKVVVKEKPMPKIQEVREEPKSFISRVKDKISFGPRKLQVYDTGMKEVPESKMEFEHRNSVVKEKSYVDQLREAEDKRKQEDYARSRELKNKYLENENKLLSLS